MYTYTISPSVFTLPPDDGSTVACIVDAQVVPVPPVVTNSCGDPVIPTGPVVGSDPVCSGTKTYTWTFVDCAGNSLPWVYTYTVTPPAFTLPADDGSTVACISDAQVAPVPPPASNSCGDPLTITGPVVGADPVCSGTKTYTFTYTDCSGTTGVWVYTYTIDPPTFTTPADDGSTVPCVSDAQVAPIPPVATNSCGDPVSATGPVVGADPVCSGTKTYTWTYTDCTGASGQWVYTYTVTPPSISLPADDGSVVNCVSDAQVVPIPPVVNNSCGDPLTLTGPVVSADPVCSGTKTYTWTYTDCTGATGDWTYTYTVTPPTSSLPADGGSTVSCISDAQVEPVPPVVNNSCGDPIVVTGPVVGPDPVCSGTKTYTWDYTDCTGTAVQWVYTYTINAPTLTLPPNDGSIVSCVLDAQVVPTPPSVTNSCGDVVTPTGPVIGADPVCSGTKTYTWTYTDCTGVGSDWTYTYTITGDTGPVFDAPPAAVSVDCVADVPPMISLNYTNTCSPGGSVTGTDSAISGSCPATIVRTWTVTDPCGNASTVTQDITINDITPPTATNPSPIVVSGCNSPVPAPDISVVTDAADNCSAPVVAFAGDVVDLVGCTETTTRSFTVTDACNNSITVTQFITRTVDTTPPVFVNPPADLTVDCISQVPPMVDLDYTDNCSPGGTIVGTETGPSGNPLTIIREWTVTDDCGNTTSLTVTITIAETNNNVSINEDLCPGETVTINGVVYDMEGTFMDTLPGIPGECDTILTIMIDTLPYNQEDINETICEGESITIHGVVYDMAGMFIDTLTGQGGECDTIVNIDITVIDYNTAVINESICPGEIVIIYGTPYDAGGMYLDTVLGVGMECDTIVTINITEETNPLDTVNASFCTGGSVFVFGVEYTSPGTYYDSIPSVTGGCDTAFTINILENALFLDTLNYLGCEGDGFSVVINGNTYDESTPTGEEILPGQGGECDTILTILLDFNSNVPPVITAVGPLCTSAGVVTLTANSPGGTWSGDVTTDQFDPAFLGPGVYEVIYTISSGACQAADTINITVYELMLSCQTLQNETAPGADDGEGQVSVSGGIAPYDISWTGPVSGSVVLNADGDFVITMLPPGVYTIEVEDATGCIATCDFTIMGSVPCDLSITVTIVDATCSGNNNGSITVGGTSTMMPILYSIDGGPYGSNNVFTGLAPGPHTVAVQDAAFCEVIQIEIVGVGPGPVLNTDEVINASCGICNGSVELVVAGGATPHNYSIDGITYVLSPLFQGLCAGTYTFYLIDDAGCTDTITTTIVSDGAPLIEDITIGNSSCGNADGSITIDASGGVDPLMYSIDGGMTFQSSPVFNGYPAGVYNVVVEDASGCPTTDIATIVDDGAPIIDGVVITPAACLTDDGTITINATGTPTLMYSINGINFQTSNFFSGLASGNYTVVVRDGNMCSVSQLVTVNTTDGPQIVDIDVTPTTCGEDNGAISIDATGGAAPLMYSIDGGATYETFPDFTDLPAGDYDVVVKDDNDCTAGMTVTINGSTGPDFDVYITAAHCGQADGCIELDGFDGQGPYTYSMNGAAGPFGPVFIFCNKVSDFYTMAIRDANGCIYEEDVFLFEASEPEIDSIVVTDPACGETTGSILVYANGLQPLMYSRQLPVFQDSNHFVNVLPGTYTITVEDPFGCADTGTAVIVANPAPVLDVAVTNTQCGMSTGAIVASATGGLPTYLYSLNNGAFGTNGNFTGLPAGTYIVRVRGSNGCENDTTVTIIGDGAQSGSLSASICDGEEFLVEGQIFTLPGMYSILIPGGASNGCDSVINLTLDVDPLIQDTLQETICIGEVYTYNGIDYSTAGTYLLDTLAAVTGCDTILNLVLTVDPLDTTYLDVTICTGGVYTIGGIDYTMEGEYLIDTISATVGCDSVRILRLQVELFNQFTIQASICEGEVYTYDGTDYSTQDTFLLDTLAGPGGCDTLLYLELVVNPLPTANAGGDLILDCDVQSVTLNGSASGGSPSWTGPDINAGNANQLMPVVSLPGQYILTVTSPEGCIAIDTVVVDLDPATVIADAGPDAFFSCDIDTIILQGGPTGPDIIYQWTGPGINASNENLPNPVITVPGIYSLVVTNTTTQCVSLPDTVEITDISVVIIAIIQDPDPSSFDCFITSIDLEATGSSTGPNVVYTWFDEDGNLVSNSPGFPVSSGGMWTLIVEDTISGCFDDDSIFIEDLTAYPPSEAGDPQVIDCNHPTVILNEGATNTLDNIIFNWYGPQGGILGPDTTLSILVGTPGMYYLVATDTTNLCQNEDSVLVTDMTMPPLASINLIENITCIDSLALLDVGTSSTGADMIYTWSGPGINNVVSDTIEPSSPGQFILNVTNASTGCAANDTVDLQLPMEPQDLMVDIDLPICEGDPSGSITVSGVTGGTPSYMYSIDGGAPTNNPNL